MQLTLQLPPVHLHPRGWRGQLHQQIGGAGTVLVDQGQHQIQQRGAAAGIKHPHHPLIEQGDHAIAIHLEVAGVWIGVEEAFNEVLLHKRPQQRLGGRINAGAVLGEGGFGLLAQDVVAIDPLEHQHPLAGEGRHHIGHLEAAVGHKL